MGSLFKTSTPAPTPPAPPASVRDEVNGVEQVPVTNADGSISYVTRAIPLTAAQQAEKDQLDAIVKESLAEIQKLSASDYAPDEATQKVLDQWKVAQKGLLTEQVSQRSQSEEEMLARRGLSDSTTAQAMRRQLALDAQKSEQAIGLQSEELANQVKAEKLALQQSLFNLASSQTDSATARTAQAATRAQSNAVALNTQRQASILDYYGAQGSGLFGNSLATALGSTLGQSAANGVTGGVSKMLGSLFLRG